MENLSPKIPLYISHTLSVSIVGPPKENPSNSKWTLILFIGNFKILHKTRFSHHKDKHVIDTVIDE